MKKTAEEMKQAAGIPTIATYVAIILELFRGIFLIIGLIVPLVGLFFCDFHDSKYNYEKNKNEGDIYCSL